MERNLPPDLALSNASIPVPVPGDKEFDYEAVVPCRLCPTSIKAWMTKRSDYRFPRPFENESMGLCEGCKAVLYLKRFASLRIAYRDWLATTYPTPSYVYGLIDPRVREVFYIGRTSDIVKRMNDHRREKRGNAKSVCIADLHAQGLTFEHCILAVAEPGYHMIELETRWICEGIRRGWPLTNGEMLKPEYVRRLQERQDIDFLTSDESHRHLPMTIYRIRAYTTWAEPGGMLPALPHWFTSEGAAGKMAHELDW